MAQLRASGTNLRFAKAVGIGRQRIITAMLIGRFRRSAGALYVLGIGHRFEQIFRRNTGLSA